MPLHYGQQQLSGPMYGHHSGQQQVQNDRPFKCDQCPQSFNRNHDLKRHKRIHLAVKPFPCVHCEKSFSRKDALKVCCSSSCIFTPRLTEQTETYSRKGMRQGFSKRFEYQWRQPVFWR